MPEFQKYFIALVPPPEIEEQIHAIKLRLSKKYATQGSLLSPAHLTLHMPFDYKVENEKKLIETLEAFTFSASIPIELENFSCFEPRVLFIAVKPNTALTKFQQEVVFHIKSRLNIFNQYESRHGFHPHITVAFRDLKKTNFYLAWEELKAEKFTAHFECGEFCLLQKEKKIWKIQERFCFV